MTTSNPCRCRPRPQQPRSGPSGGALQQGPKLGFCVSRTQPRMRLLDFWLREISRRLAIGCRSSKGLTRRRPQQKEACFRTNRPPLNRHLSYQAIYPPYPARPNHADPVPPCPPALPSRALPYSYRSLAHGGVGGARTSTACLTLCHASQRAFDHR